MFPISGCYGEISLSTALEAAMTWCEQQSECSSAEVLSFKTMGDKGAEKKLITRGSKKIQDYFKK